MKTFSTILVSNPHDAKAQVGVARIERVDIAERAAREQRGGMPGAAAADFLLAGGRAGGIVDRRFGIVIRRVPIVGPFPDVAVHVAQAEGIGRIAADGGGQGVAVVGVEGFVLADSTWETF